MLANALVVAYNEMSIDGRRKEMARIILSDAVQFGIKGTTKSKPRAGKKYQELVRESDKKIDEDRFRYAHAYKKASTYLAR